MARPTKYNKKLGEKTRDLLARGYSNRVTAGLIGIDEVTFYDWIKKNPKFSQYVKEGRSKGEQHYMDCANDLITGKVKGSADMLKFVVKNIYRWKENPADDVASTTKIEIHIDGDDEKL